MIPIEPLLNIPEPVRKYLLAVWRPIRWVLARIARITLYISFCIFFRNEKPFKGSDHPKLNVEDLLFLVICTMLLVIVANILYWTKVIGFHP